MDHLQSSRPIFANIFPLYSKTHAAFLFSACTLSTVPFPFQKTVIATASINFVCTFSCIQHFQPHIFPVGGGYQSSRGGNFAADGLRLFKWTEKGTGAADRQTANMGAERVERWETEKKPSSGARAQKSRERDENTESWGTRAWMRKKRASHGCGMKAKTRDKNTCMLQKNILSEPCIRPFSLWRPPNPWYIIYHEKFWIPKEETVKSTKDEVKVAKYHYYKVIKGNI